MIDLWSRSVAGCVTIVFLAGIGPKILPSSRKEKRIFFTMGMNSANWACNLDDEATWMWFLKNRPSHWKTQNGSLWMRIVAVGISDSLFKSESFSSQFLCRPESRKSKAKNVLRRTFKLSHLHNWQTDKWEKTAGHRETGKSWLVTVCSCSFTVSCFSNKQCLHK